MASGPRTQWAQHTVGSAHSGLLGLVRLPVVGVPSPPSCFLPVTHQEPAVHTEPGPRPPSGYLAPPECWSPPRPMQLASRSLGLPSAPAHSSPLLGQLTLKPPVPVLKQQPGPQPPGPNHKLRLGTRDCGGPGERARQTRGFPSPARQQRRRESLTLGFGAVVRLSSGLLCEVALWSCHPSAS